LTEKYVVLKHEDWCKILSDLLEFVPARLFDEMNTYPIISDAVVLRKQDKLTGPCLHLYATTAALAAELSTDEVDVSRLLQISDYFHEEALDADSMDTKLPD